VNKPKRAFTEVQLNEISANPSTPAAISRETTKSSANYFICVEWNETSLQVSRRGRNE